MGKEMKSTENSNIVSYSSGSLANEGDGAEIADK
jgi:hypothetical protein